MSDVTSPIGNKLRTELTEYERDYLETHPNSALHNYAPPANTTLLARIEQLEIQRDVDVAEIRDRDKTLLALRETLKEARESIEHWAGYASDYFRDKWNLDADLAAVDAVLADTAEAVAAIEARHDHGNQFPTPCPACDAQYEAHALLRDTKGV